MQSSDLDKIVSLGKRRGFFYPGSEIYGGLANTYDYGPMGVELLRNIKNLWWKYFVQNRADIVGLDSGIISSAKVWEASGHTSGFSDAMVDCKNCKSRFRADHIIEDNLKDTKVEGLSLEELESLIKKHSIKCPKCGKHDWTNIRKFNLLFPVKLGIVEGDQSLAYLRGETAQGIFINFKNVFDSTRVRLPFGIAQLGKSFRNEITLGNSIFRTIEFEQGEIEYFFNPNENNWEELFEEWKKTMFYFITQKLKIKEENLRWREHTPEERSFYSKRTEDLEYNYPFGFKELWGLAYRTDYDLQAHIKASRQDLSIQDPKTNQKVLPHVIEPAVGITRMVLMVLCDAYSEEENRVVLKLDPKLAPYKVAVFPLVSNKEDIVGKAKEVFDILKEEFTTNFDDRGNIGKRYLYQDEIGTPFCITIDYQTLEDQTVTVRNRDSMEQERISINDLSNYLHHKLK